MDKEVKYISLDEMQLTPENLLMAKIDIESNISEDQKLTLVDFISNLQMNKVYTYKKQMISFSIKEGNQYDYVFYIELANINDESTRKLKEEAFLQFKKKLEEIKYDLSNLKLKNSVEIIEKGIDILDFGEYFIINNNFYI